MEVVKQCQQNPAGHFTIYHRYKVCLDQLNFSDNYKSDVKISRTGTKERYITVVRQSVLNSQENFSNNLV